jgi:hypothetical protein
VRLSSLRLLIACLVLPVLAAGQAPNIRVPDIGVIDFFGLHKVPEERLRKALGFQEGDPLPRSKGDVEEALEQVPGVALARLEAACCEDGKAVLYVGIQEKGTLLFEFRDPPDKPVLMPEEIHDTYVHFLAALGQAVRAQDTSEDLTPGHSLMANPQCRALQEQFIVQAKQHLDNIRDVLRNSADEEQRAIAAYVIGYAPKKQEVVEDLQYALRDPDDTVRNNAMRSLGAISVLAQKKPELEIHISPTWMVEMLNSIVWTDRNTATIDLLTLTENRDPKVLDLIRERALPSLIAMARWKHLPHALPAYILLGRVAGMKEKEIEDSWSQGKREEVIRKIEEQFRK